MSTRRYDPVGWSALALAAATAWGGWLVLQETVLLALAIAVQALGAILLFFTVQRHRRGLALTLAVSVPVVGLAAAIWIESTRSRGGDELLVDPHVKRRRLDGSEIARRLTASLPPCDAIVSGDVEARRATISRLVERSRSEDVAVLRWAHRQSDSDISVEAALALEEIGQRFEVRLRKARDAAKANPTPAAHATIVSTISNGVRTGIVDNVMVSKLVAEARRHHLIALVADPTLAEQLALAIAPLELAARQPLRALAALRAVTGPTSSNELLALQREAAYAARRFDELPSAVGGEVAVGGR
jgi:hypothetical protein